MKLHYLVYSVAEKLCREGTYKTNINGNNGTNTVKTTIKLIDKYLIIVINIPSWNGNKKSHGHQENKIAINEIVRAKWRR